LETPININALIDYTRCTSSAGRHCITFMSPLETGASVLEVRITLELIWFLGIINIFGTVR